MKNSNKKSLFFFFLLLFLAVACGAPQKPVEFQPGEFQCSHCLMGITDMRFRGEFITNKGKIYRFDSIECLVAWSQENHQHIGSSWIADFHNPKDWIELNKALILHSKKINSPMGAGLSAFKSDNDLTEAIKMYGGDKMNLSELEAFIAQRQNLPAELKPDSIDLNRRSR